MSELLDFLDVALCPSPLEGKGTDRERGLFEWAVLGAGPNAMACRWHRRLALESGRPWPVPNEEDERALALVVDQGPWEAPWPAVVRTLGHPALLSRAHDEAWGAVAQGKDSPWKESAAALMDVDSSDLGPNKGPLWKEPTAAATGVEGLRALWVGNCDLTGLAAGTSHCPPAQVDCADGASVLGVRVIRRRYGTASDGGWVVQVVLLGKDNSPEAILALQDRKVRFELRCGGGHRVAAELSLKWSGGNLASDPWTIKEEEGWLTVSIMEERSEGPASSGTGRRGKPIRPRWRALVKDRALAL